MKTVGMKTWAAILCLGGIWTAGAGGEDLKTLGGQTYSNIVVQQFDRQGLYIRYDGGTTQVFFREVMPELRSYYKSRSLYPLPVETTAGEKEAPAGPGDLQTVTGQIYRNVALKQVFEDSILIAHDTGMSTIHFSALTPEQVEQYRTATPVPDPAPGANDLMTTSGQIFRHIEVVRAEPDGLTIRHDGGVSKLWFIVLPEELQKKYNFDPIAARNYQREIAASNRAALVAALVVPVATTPATFEILKTETDTLTNNEFWVRFTVKNLTSQNLNIFVVPCEKTLTPIVAGKPIAIAPSATNSMQQFTVPEIQPAYLKVTAGNYFTNCVLTWK